jgi:hypothetical protein
MLCPTHPLDLITLIIFGRDYNYEVPRYAILIICYSDGDPLRYDMNLPMMRLHGVITQKIML